MERLCSMPLVDLTGSRTTPHRDNSPPDKNKASYCSPGPRSLGLLPSRTTHQTNINWVKPLIRTNIYRVGNCPKAPQFFLLYWHNGLLKNRVGRSVIFLIYFLTQAVCPFIHTSLCIYSLKTYRQNRNTYIESRPYNLNCFMKISYNFFWQLYNFLRKLHDNEKNF